MTLAFLRLSPDERKLYIDEAAARRGLSPIILEKDFWVCWLLGVLFESSFRDAIVFKGGTSLSKVFGVINRFSEDIDLSLAPASLGLDEPDATAALSKSQANKWMERAEATCTAVVRDKLAPEIAAAIGSRLGESEGTWLTFEVDASSHSPVLLFHYPTTQPPALEYLKRSVKLEFGSLTDQRPTASHAVRPWIADVLPDAFADWHCDVVALDLHRAFWEKATILHVEHHRPADKPTPPAPSPSLSCAIVWSSGRAASSAAPGRATTWRCRRRSSWYLRPTVRPRFGATIRPCATCTCQNRSHSIGSSRHWLTSSSRSTKRGLRRRHQAKSELVVHCSRTEYTCHRNGNKNYREF